jgi:hypothetical protein
MGPDSVRTLRVWQEGMALVKQSYALTAAWPKSELFGLTSQIPDARLLISTPDGIKLFPPPTPHHLQRSCYPET